MRQYIKLLTGATTLAVAFSLTACGDISTSSSSTEVVDAVSIIREYDNIQNIKVVTREVGSGTRNEFIEAFDIYSDEVDFSTDPIYEDAITAHETDIALANVITNGNAIAYISLGEVDESVKVLSIDGVEPTIENVANGTYIARRPFNLVKTEVQSEIAKDFEKFILSQSGQNIIAEKYVRAEDFGVAYNGGRMSGELRIGGSSSMASIMRKLIAGYQAVNPDVEISLQIENSTLGVQGVKDGIYDIGMVSRDLLKSETYVAESTTIAYDGIAIIVNNTNPINNLTSEEVNHIYIGIYKSWSLMEIADSNR